MNDKSPLLGSLAYWLSVEKLDARWVVPAVRDLLAEAPQSLSELLESL